MAFKLANRVKETSSNKPTAGGSSNLSGAVSLFRTFVSQVGTTNSTIVMRIGTNEWEVVTATVTDATPDTLTDITLLDSSTGSLIDWSTATGEDESPTCACVDSARNIRTRVQVHDITSSTATAEFLNLEADSQYIIDYEEFLPTGDDIDLLLQVSDDNGSTWKTTGYLSSSFFHFSGGSSSGSTNTTGIICAEQAGSVAGEYYDGRLVLSNVNRTGVRFSARSNWCGLAEDSGTYEVGDAGGRYDTEGAMDAVRLIPSSGNIANIRTYLTYIPTVDLT